jgi:hypothetical protein
VFIMLLPITSRVEAEIVRLRLCDILSPVYINLLSDVIAVGLTPSYECESSVWEDFGWMKRLYDEVGLISSIHAAQ